MASEFRSSTHEASAAQTPSQNTLTPLGMPILAQHLALSDRPATPITAATTTQTSAQSHAPLTASPSPTPQLENTPDLLIDRFGRVARDLRVSLTDRCNLRCSYCMPAEGLEWLPTEETLTDDEVIRLCRIGVEVLGIEHIRFTGGEPLLRAGLEKIIAACSAFRTAEGNTPDLALTTNALGLDRRINGLKDAGLQRVNISLDTLDPAHFAAITRRDRLHDALKGLHAAIGAGLSPIKVNAVLLRGINEGDAADLLDFCLDNNVELRIIEQMPIGPPQSWSRETLVTYDEIIHALSTRHTLTPLPRDDRHSPAQTWVVDGNTQHRIGIIASVSAPFCDACDRTRLTSDGQIRSCLFSTRETDLRTLLRCDASDRDIADTWKNAMWSKPAAHGLDTSDFATPSRTMSRIGG
ncbi:MAG: GTP 3',8-cyclase MoaA [Actinomycetaceae bacterium]|nr:GTP 3',8-cyclase MoaA [Actinomycetaceae bacterium]